MLNIPTIGKILIVAGFLLVMASAILALDQPEPFRIGGNIPFIAGIVVLLVGMALAAQPTKAYDIFGRRA